LASDDANASVVRIPEEFKENVKDATVNLLGHQKRVGVIKFNPSASGIVATGSYDNTVKVWDVNTQVDVSTYTPFEDFVQGIEWSADGSRMVATAKDRYIRIFDPRQLETAISVLGFEGAKTTKAVFADNHNKVFATGFTKQNSRAIAFYDPRNMEHKIDEVELDQSAGVLLPFYDSDVSMLWITGKGDGNIRYYEVDDEEPFMHSLDEFRSNIPHKGVCFTPKSGVNYAANEVAFCLRLQKSLIEPIHFIVPRKGDQFQADLYPETFAGRAFCTGEEWISGTSGVPEKCDIREAAAAQSAHVEFVVRKNAAELEKELAEALDRIKQLEAEVAALRG